MNREPKIVAFLCHWCSYTGADLAGTSRIKYEPNARIIRVMCSGRIDAAFVLKAIREGADGVLICGCHPGDCHYQVGNEKAQRRHIMLKQMIGQFGIEKERIRLEWISASEGDQFAKLVNEFTEQIRNLGPLNWKENMRPSLRSE
jgi:F420-non-reducing hydrogenase iron-sulfur subunit